MAQDQDPNQKIVAKASKDKAFRAALLSNPNAAIEKELGIKLPQGVKIKVVEDSASQVHLVLPPASDGALSDAQLKNVAGGGASCRHQNTLVREW